MELDRRDFRAMMFYDFMRKLSVEQSFPDAFQDQVLHSYSGAVVSGIQEG